MSAIQCKENRELMGHIPSELGAHDLPYLTHGEVAARLMHKTSCKHFLWSCVGQLKHRSALHMFHLKPNALGKTISRDCVGGVKIRQYRIVLRHNVV